MSEYDPGPTVAVEQYPGLAWSQDDEIAYLKAHGRFPLSKNAGAFVTGVLVKSGGCTCFSVSGISNRASAQYIWLYDGIVAPAANAAPNGPVIYVPTGPINYSISFSSVGRRFFTGLYIANSTSATAFTAGSADTAIDAQYT